MNIENLIFTLPAWQKTLVRKTGNENCKYRILPGIQYNLFERKHLLPTYTNLCTCLKKKKNKFQLIYIYYVHECHFFKLL